MKAVILAAGVGTRLKPITSSIPKPMIPLAGRPLLEHNIIGLKEAGVNEILLIVGYKKKIIKDYFKKGDKLGVSIEYITQEEYRGTAHATGYGKDFVKNEPFLMMYGDILVDQVTFKKIIQLYKETNADGLISLLEVENPQNYGIISLDRQNYVKEIVEKPSSDQDVGNLANAGIYILPQTIFKAIEKTKLSKRGEYELTDSLEILIHHLNNRIIGYAMKETYWNDIGLPWQLLDANEYLLSIIKEDIKGTIENKVIIEGNVQIGEGTIVKAGSYLKGPCYIGKNCIIGPNAFIRSGTSIQDNCHVGICEIKNSLIFSNTNIPHFNYIGDSILCNNVNLGAGTKIANLRFDGKTIKVHIKGKVINSHKKKLGAIIGAHVKTGIDVSIMCGKKIGMGSRIGPKTLVLEDIPNHTLYYQDPSGNIITEKLM
jgi:bifunctional UDP-N-acetylglucosamine pyrophosphorylase/glucosamine-1-phosphate N-acetyltransferase